MIVDDHPVVRMGVKTSLEQTRDIRVVAEAESGEQALRVVAAVRPSVILMDIGLPGIDGIETTYRIRQLNNDAKIIMLTSRDSEDEIATSIAAGAAGYCLKGGEPERLQLAIRSVHAGAIWFDSLVGQKITSEYCRNRMEQRHKQVETAGNGGGNGAERFNNLSDRELEVLELLAAGCSNQEMAGQLHISLPTIKTHVRNIFKRLGVEDRTQAAVKAIRMRIVND